MKYAIVFLVLAALLGLAAGGFGHPPGKITADFDPEDLLLTVSAMHGVSDAARHYIEEIEVELEGKKVIEQKFASQTDVTVQEVLYRIIDAGVGDRIKVTAGCNISGKNRVEIAVEQQPEKTPGEEDTRAEDAEG